MKIIRNGRRLVVIVLFFIVIFPAVSQEKGAGDKDQKESQDFFLLPILEIVFSQNVKWRPDWPVDIPPDAFVVSRENREYEVIELSNETDSFVIRRDRQGRLLEFPFFYDDKYAVVKPDYAASGVLSKMNVTIKNYSSAGESEQSDEMNIDITFPDNFYPYSELSPGGAFSPLSVSIDDAPYYIFIFESPVFISETWFDSGGNMFFYCKASVNAYNGTWRIRTMEIQNEGGALFIDYFFDSYGNITEIKSNNGLFMSLCSEYMPVYWRTDDVEYELFWDTQNILQIIKASELIDNYYTEYRYEYSFDNFGAWIKRQEAAYINNYNLLLTNPSYSRGIWNRRIVYFE